MAKLSPISNYVFLLVYVHLRNDKYRVVYKSSAPSLHFELHVFSIPVDLQHFGVEL